MRLMEGEHVGPFNLGNPGEFTMLELAEVSLVDFNHILPNLVGLLFGLCFDKTNLWKKGFLIRCRMLVDLSLYHHLNPF